MSTRTGVIEDLVERELVASSTDLAALSAAAGEGPLTLYCGFDPTAPSLHIGHLMQTRTLRRFQVAGHRPLALVGGATGLIGDPKMAGERVLNDADVVAAWGGRIRGQLESLLDFTGQHAAAMVNNYDWTAGLSALDFLRDVGKHFSVNRMLDRDAVRARLAGDGISFTEFSYQLLQSYDYLQLYRRYDCRLQIGGSDQWGNLTAGVDLIRRTDGARVHALTTPLLTRSDGTKFGKTEGGASIWLDPALTSPYAFHQFWLNAEDAKVGPLLRTFSFRSIAEIAALEEQASDRPQDRVGQRALATELTTLVHGAPECAKVERAAAAMFGQDDLRQLDAETLGAALDELGPVVVDPSELEAGLSLAGGLVRAGLAPSLSAARRTIGEGGAYVNNVRIDDADHRLGAADLLHGRWVVLRRGRKNLNAITLGSAPR